MFRAAAPESANMCSMKIYSAILKTREPNLSAVLYYIQNNKPGVIGVTEWPHKKDGNWAIYINMAPYGDPNDQAFIPFSWGYAGEPPLEEAVELLRNRCTKN